MCLLAASLTGSSDLWVPSHKSMATKTLSAQKPLTNALVTSDCQNGSATKEVRTDTPKKAQSKREKPPNADNASSKNGHRKKVSMSSKSKDSPVIQKPEKCQRNGGISALKMSAIEEYRQSTSSLCSKDKSKDGGQITNINLVTYTVPNSTPNHTPKKSANKSKPPMPNAVGINSDSPTPTSTSPSKGKPSTPRKSQREKSSSKSGCLLCMSKKGEYLPLYLQDHCSSLSTVPGPLVPPSPGLLPSLVAGCPPAGCSPTDAPVVFPFRYTPSLPPFCMADKCIDL